jgi:phage terminase Nu1 subunit (DNA packaging protein)
VPDFIVGRTEAAKFFGISVQALQKWFARGAPAGKKVGRQVLVDLSAVAQWRLGRNTESEFDQARTRLAIAQADKTELESAELAGQVIRTDEVIECWARSAGAMRSRLLSLPAKIGPRVRVAQNDQEAAAIVETEVLEALQELSTDGIPERTAARRARAAPGGRATTTADGQPVGGRAPAAVQRKRGRARPVANG